MVSVAVHGVANKRREVTKVSDKVGTLTFKWDFNWFMGGVSLAAMIFVGVLAIEFLDTIGAQRDMFEAIGKWGSLIEDGYNAQREIK